MAKNLRQKVVIRIDGFNAGRRRQDADSGHDAALGRPDHGGVDQGGVLNRQYGGDVYHQLPAREDGPDCHPVSRGAPKTGR
ncbi:MAG: hypothetical protein MZV64_71425 [Ignavibacteriales bacterium]|nr:hypothetical protein [Ignavibacteriales bacterium]